MTSTEPKLIPHTKRKLTTSITNIICCITLTTSIYAIYKVNSLQNSLQRHTHSQQKVNERCATFASVQENLNTKIHNLNTKVALLQKNILNENNELNIDKARFYLQTAALKIKTSYDFATAKSLYNQAVELLKIKPEFSDLAIYDTQTPSHNLVTLLSDLDTAIQMINELQSAPLPTYQPPPTTTSSKIIDKLKSVIIIRHHNEEIKPLPHDVELDIKRRDLALKFQTAQWSLIAKNQQLYEISLQQAQNIIENNFEKSSSQKLLTTIESLRATSIINDSKKLHQEIIKTLDQLNRTTNSDVIS